MELSFVFEAARRYAWLIVVCVLLGALPGLAAQRSAEASFESRAVLIVVPARDARVQISVTGANERYVLGQLAVLRSDTLANQVVQSLGGDVTLAELRASVTLRHDSDTDIVEIVAASGNPQRAKSIADAYANEYLASLATQLDPEGSPEIAELDTQLADLSERIADVDAEITVAMAPFLEAVTAPGTELTTLPTIEQVAPGLVSQRQLLTADYLGRLTARTDLALGSQLTVATEIIERATTPEFPVAQRRSLLIAAGIIGGAMVGLFLAALFARITPRLLSPRHATETLGGQPVLGPMRWTHREMDGLLGVDTKLDRSQLDTLTTIRSSLMVTPGSDRAMIILVAGSSPASGSENIASSLASLWASDGYQTVLVDADLRRRSLTSSISTDTRPSFDEEATFSIDDELVDTLKPGLLLLPAGSGEATATLRERIETLLEEVDSITDVVVFDVGALLGSTFGLDLARSADGVVLAIGADTRSSSLTLVARQLAGQRDRLTTIWTSPPKRWGKPKRPGEPRVARSASAATDLADTAETETEANETSDSRNAASDVVTADE